MFTSQTARLCDVWNGIFATDRANRGTDDPRYGRDNRISGAVEFRAVRVRDAVLAPVVSRTKMRYEEN